MGGASGRFIERSGGYVHSAFAEGFGETSPASPHPQIIGESRLFGIFGVGGAAGDDVIAGEPAVQVDVAAAAGAEREFGGVGGLAADRAGFGRGLVAGLVRPAGLGRVSWH